MFCIIMLHVSLRGEQMPTLYAAFKGSGIMTHIGNTPTQFLCNEAYWYLLKKCNCHALFFHVPSIKYVTEDFIAKIRAVLC